MLETLVPYLVPLVALVPLAFFINQAAFWIRLARIYPLAEEWPSRSFPSTPVAVGLFLDRVTVGANSRGITFHGMLMRLSGSGVFVPWQAVTAAPESSLFIRNATRLSFKAAPSVNLVMPGSVWENVITQQPARLSVHTAGV